MVVYSKLAPSKKIPDNLTLRKQTGSVVFKKQPKNVGWDLKEYYYNYFKEIFDQQRNPNNYISGSGKSYSSGGAAGSGSDMPISSKDIPFNTPNQYRRSDTENIANSTRDYLNTRLSWMETLVDRMKDSNVPPEQMSLFWDTVTQYFPVDMQRNFTENYYIMRDPNASQKEVYDATMNLKNIITMQQADIAKGVPVEYPVRGINIDDPFFATGKDSWKVWMWDLNFITDSMLNDPYLVTDYRDRSDLTRIQQIWSTGGAVNPKDSDRIYELYIKYASPDYVMAAIEQGYNKSHYYDIVDWYNNYKPTLGSKDQATMDALLPKLKEGLPLDKYELEFLKGNVTSFEEENSELVRFFTEGKIVVEGAAQAGGSGGGDKTILTEQSAAQTTILLLQQPFENNPNAPQLPKNVIIPGVVNNSKAEMGLPSLGGLIARFYNAQTPEAQGQIQDYFGKQKAAYDSTKLLGSGQSFVKDFIAGVVGVYTVPLAGTKPEYIVEDNRYHWVQRDPNWFDWGMLGATLALDAYSDKLTPYLTKIPGVGATIKAVGKIESGITTGAKTLINKIPGLSSLFKASANAADDIERVVASGATRQAGKQVYRDAAGNTLQYMDDATRTITWTNKAGKTITKQYQNIDDFLQAQTHFNPTTASNIGTVTPRGQTPPTSTGGTTPNTNRQWTTQKVVDIGDGRVEVTGTQTYTTDIERWLGKFNITQPNTTTSSVATSGTSNLWKDLPWYVKSGAVASFGLGILEGGRRLVSDIGFAGFVAADTLMQYDKNTITYTQKYDPEISAAQLAARLWKMENVLYPVTEGNFLARIVSDLPYANTFFPQLRTTQLALASYEKDNAVMMAQAIKYGFWNKEENRPSTGGEIANWYAQHRNDTSVFKFPSRAGDEFSKDDKNTVPHATYLAIVKNPQAYNDSLQLAMGLDITASFDYAESKGAKIDEKTKTALNREKIEGFSILKGNEGGGSGGQPSGISNRLPDVKPVYTSFGSMDTSKMTPGQSATYQSLIDAKDTNTIIDIAKQNGIDPKFINTKKDIDSIKLDVFNTKIGMDNDANIFGIDRSKVYAPPVTTQNRDNYFTKVQQPETIKWDSKYVPQAATYGGQGAFNYQQPSVSYDPSWSANVGDTSRPWLGTGQDVFSWSNNWTPPTFTQQDFNQAARDEGRRVAELMFTPAVIDQTWGFAQLMDEINYNPIDNLKKDKKR